MSAPDRRQFLHASAGGAAALFLAPSFELLHPTILGAPLSIAVIGVGRQGRAILGELATIPEASVVAVCDSDDS
ncbi:MAG: gfo/Idh/MocA family oxidoreductase, partial [Planctomycetota bacterium]